MTPEKTILSVDIGNTAVKIAVLEAERIIQSACGRFDSSRDLCEAVSSMLTFNSADGAVLCSVAGDPDELKSMLEVDFGLPVVVLDAETPLPMQVNYSSRQSLGVDRIAAAVGVAAPGKASLVVDAGTALTADVVAQGFFIGGNISPGLRLRFKSLADYTARIPLVDPDGPVPEFGNDTLTAVRSGVVLGLVDEIVADFHRAGRSFGVTDIVLTGGDAEFLLPLISKAGIAVTLDPDAVHRGLIRIFNFVSPLSFHQYE